MKFTIFVCISMLFAIVQAKTQPDEGRSLWTYEEREVFLNTFYKCMDDAKRNENCDHECAKCKCNTPECDKCETKCKCDHKCSENDGRRLAHDESFWSSLDDSCYDTTYGANVVVDGVHLFFIAKPQDKDSKCPGVVVDNGKKDADHDTLAPHVSILDESPAEGLALDHSLTLGLLSEALSQMNPTDYSISTNEYNLTGNNCATFLLHLCKKIGLDYHETATNANIVNYVGKSLAADEHFVDNVREAYLKENTGIFHQMKFSVWEYYVGDEGMTRALVKNYMDITE